MENRGVTQVGDKSSPGMSSPLNIARSTEIRSKEQDHESGQGRMRAPRSNTRDEGKDSEGDIPNETDFAGAEKQRDTPRGSHVGDCSTSKERVVESTESSIPVGTNIDIAKEDSFLPGSGMVTEKIDVAVNGWNTSSSGRTEKGAYSVGSSFLASLSFDVLYSVQFVSCDVAGRFLLFLKQVFWCPRGLPGLLLPCAAGLGCSGFSFGFTCRAVERDLIC
ncbi:hypothetical protein Ancab_002311 [Ancistrocladus abbreviatus]